MSGGKKEISDVESFGGVGVPNTGRKGRVRVNERKDQPPELLDATGMGRHRRDAGQKRGMHRKRFFD